MVLFKNMERRMIVKLTQKLARGFGPWKQMFFDNEAELNKIGGSLIFAGTDKDDDNMLTVILHFDSPESLKAFADHEDLKAKRKEAGALLETTVVTVMCSDAFTETS